VRFSSDSPKPEQVEKSFAGLSVVEDPVFQIFDFMPARHRPGSLRCDGIIAIPQKISGCPL
jgi:hypothetical protein